MSELGAVRQRSDSMGTLVEQTTEEYLQKILNGEPHPSLSMMVGLQLTWSQNEYITAAELVDVLNRLTEDIELLSPETRAKVINDICSLHQVFTINGATRLSFTFGEINQIILAIEAFLSQTSTGETASLGEV